MTLLGLAAVPDADPLAESRPLAGNLPLGDRAKGVKRLLGISGNCSPASVERPLSSTRTVTIGYAFWS
jgi:hypothetical protein